MSGWAELAKAALDVMGKSAPWVVIACLAAFGIYKLQELNEHNLFSVQQIAEKERTQAREDFSVANKALKDTYEAANKLYTEMMASVGTSLKQLQTLESEVREKQKTVFQSQIDAERTKLKLELQQSELAATQSKVDQVRAQVDIERKAVEAARKQTTEALASKVAAESSIQELSNRLVLEKKDLENTTRQLEEAKNQVEEKRQELRQAITRVTDTSVLVYELARLPDNPSMFEIMELRRKARAVVPNVQEFLRRYHDQPVERKNLDMSSLVGTKMPELKDALQSAAGFSWFAAYSTNRNVRIIALPDDQVRRPFINNGIAFKLSDLPKEKIELFNRNPMAIFDENATVTAIERAEIIIFRCVNPITLDETTTMELSNGSVVVSFRESALGTELALTEALNDAYAFGVGGRIFKLKGGGVVTTSPLA